MKMHVPRAKLSFKNPEIEYQGEKLLLGSFLSPFYGHYREDLCQTIDM